MKSSALIQIEKFADQVAAGILACDAQASIIYANRAAGLLLGQEAATLLHTPMADLHGRLTDAQGDALAWTGNPVASALREGQPVSLPRVGIRAMDGQLAAWVKITANPIFHDDEDCRATASHRLPGQIDHVVVTLIDISQEVLTAARLRESEERLNQIMSLLPVGVCITDERGYFEFANRAYQQFYGYSEGEMIGQHFSMILPTEESKRQMTRLHDDFIGSAEGKELRREWRVVDRQGRQRVILTDGTRIVGADGKFRRVTSIVDISDRRELEQRLRQTTRGLEKLAITDVLTDLYNRRHADHLLGEEARRAEISGDGLVVAMLDIDHFKRVNDRFGHACGDEVLIAVSRAIRSSLRDEDHACRYGGEEFLLILPATSLASSMHALMRLADQVRKLLIPPVDNPITLSAGVSAFADGEEIETTVKRADAALYRAKAAGRDRIFAA